MAFPYAGVAFAHTETMKTDGLGRGPASWGRLHPVLWSSLPLLPVFFFLLHFLSFLLWLCLSFALLFLSSGTLFLLFTFFLKQGDKNRVAHLPRRARHLSPPPPSPDPYDKKTPPSPRTASPYDKSCWDCLGTCFGQKYKRSPGTIKNVFSGGRGWDFLFPP